MMLLLRHVLSMEEQRQGVAIGANNDGSTTITKSLRQHLDSSLKHHHHHKIPNNLLFTHYINLLTFEPTTQSSSSSSLAENLALKHNVENTIQLNSGSIDNIPVLQQQQVNVHFWTDADCIESIRRVLPSLEDFFRQESHGMYKADICRGAGLYEMGGLYFDVDIQARMNLWDVIHPSTTFVTCLVHHESRHPGNFFQAFIGVTPQNPIMMRYLELFLEHYRGKIDIQGPLGVILLRRAHDEIMRLNKFGRHHHRRPDDADEVKQIEQQRKEQKIELWQEVKYHPKLFPNVSPPTWGTRRACKFVVVANRERPFIVPFYSRVAGSRMCGGAQSRRKEK